MRAPAPAGYTPLQIALHWIAAALILLQYVLHDAISGAWEARGKGVATAFDPLVMAHVVGGALIMIVALWRLTIRARRGAPATAGDSAAQRLLAGLTHVGLYGLMILMALSGSMAWFGGVGAAAGMHNLLKVALLAVVALHVVGALYHHFVLRDGLMRRITRAQS